MFLFKKRKNSNDLKAYISGDLISIDQVNDDAFSQKMMGDGIAIKPKGNEVYAPCDGKVTAIFDSTEHAVGLTLDNGMEILIHCGLDTVNLTEKVFSCKVTKEQKVKQGQLLLTFDHDKLKAMNYEDVIMLVLLNPGNAKNVKFVSDQPVQAKESVIATFE